MFCGVFCLFFPLPVVMETETVFRFSEILDVFPSRNAETFGPLEIRNDG